MKGLVFISIIAVVIAVAESRECYQCFLCESSFRKESALKTQCIYTDACLLAEVTFNNGTVLTTRACAEGIAIPSFPAGRSEDVYLSKAVVNICKENLCNGATLIGSTAILLAFASVIVHKLAVN